VTPVSPTGSGVCFDPPCDVTPSGTENPGIETPTGEQPEAWDDGSEKGYINIPKAPLEKMTVWALKLQLFSSLGGTNASSFFFL